MKYSDIKTPVLVINKYGNVWIMWPGKKCVYSKQIGGSGWLPIPASEITIFDKSIEGSFGGGSVVVIPLKPIFDKLSKL